MPTSLLSTSWQAMAGVAPRFRLGDPCDSCDSCDSWDDYCPATGNRCLQTNSRQPWAKRWLQVGADTSRRSGAGPVRGGSTIGWRRLSREVGNLPSCSASPHPAWRQAGAGGARARLADSSDRRAQQDRARPRPSALGGWTQEAPRRGAGTLPDSRDKMNAPMPITGADRPRLSWRPSN
jgi:hypothetical protein